MNRVQYQLVSVDLENYQGQLRVIREGTSYWRKITVEISALLMSRIISARQDSTKFQMEGVTFTSDIDDPLFINNPFKLKKFNWSNGKHKNFRLQLVNEKGSYMDFITDRYGHRYNRKVYTRYSSAEFVRYAEFTTKLIQPI